MTLGPVQLIMLGFDDPQCSGEIRAELDWLRDSYVVRLLDAVVVGKGADGNVVLVEENDLNDDEYDDPGAVLGALIGLVDDAGEVDDGSGEGREPGSVAGAGDSWVLDDLLPAGMYAAIVLVEHRWASGLRDSIRRAGGVHLIDAWIHPEDLVTIGASEPS
ncbi:hypothetical protein CLV30_109118 [Haloactinopolyspora alba]|uniref:DUF1269 domain-containing protein n=1 Tax=Haloactinopolyspora alba TaxID=648780 RepID=A0A2P8E025_9ACTN|nr:DUF6325 family protein [Haloactinopolyspora alba]PSL02810.1 hypothetical protein CLV30_109118 [Haloactinopolyspora alba]